MTTWNLLIIGVGTLLLLISRSRVKTTIDVHDRVVLAARSLWLDAERRGIDKEPTLILVYNSLILIAASSPLIAVGRTLDLQKEAESPLGSEARDADIVEFIERNAWLLPYLGTAICGLQRLQFQARPWHPLLALNAFIAWAIMTFRSDPDGRVRVFHDVTAIREQVGTLHIGDRLAPTG